MSALATLSTQSQVAERIADTAIPRVAWKRAGLPMELYPDRPTLGDCHPSELYALMTIETTTPEGYAFTRFAAALADMLEANVRAKQTVKEAVG